MGANTKTGFKGFDYMHCDDFARYLEEMAAKGWHFKEWGVGLKFEKGEPENATYAVEVFTKASENDLRPEPHTQEFAEYCEAAGWKLMDAKQKFCIFKKIKEDAIELFTPEERVTNAFKGTVSGSTILLFTLYGINAFLQWLHITSFFEQNIFSGTWMFSCVIWSLMFFMQMCIFVSVFLKKRKWMQQIRDGKEVYIGIQQDGRRHLSIRSFFVVVLLIAMMLYLLLIHEVELFCLNLVVIMITLVFAAVMAKIRPNSTTNFGLQILFALVIMTVIFIAVFAVGFERGEKDVVKKNEITEYPLLISDYRECPFDIEDSSVYMDTNILGSHGKYFIFTEEDAIYYDIYRSEHAWILDKIWDEELDAKYNKGAVDCSAEWEAQKAVRNKIGIYYVRYDDSIFVLSDDEDIYLTQKQINIIRDKMDLR